MKQSRIMKERIRRVRLLFKELGYELEEEEYDSEVYSAGFRGTSRPGGVIYIDRHCRFVEIAYSYLFSIHLSGFLRTQLAVFQDICYEFGCYYLLRNEDDHILFTVHSKIYYAGLNYFALKETLRDLSSAIHALEEQMEMLFNSEDRGTLHEDT